MNKADGEDTADRLSGIVASSLDTPAKTQDLARQAYQSRTQFHRLFRTVVEETPAAMRRRLLLERAAYQLAHTGTSVTDIALDANYGSLEAFTRAFRRAFGISPSLYRRSGCARIHLPAPNAFHFLPENPGLKGASKNMDLFDLFAGTDSWYTRRLLQEAAALNDEQLDRAVNGTAKVMGWDKPDSCLREILERIIQTKEVWTAAITAGDMPDLDGRPPEERTPMAL